MNFEYNEKKKKNTSTFVDSCRYLFLMAQGTFGVLSVCRCEQDSEIAAIAKSRQPGCERDYYIIPYDRKEIVCGNSHTESENLIGLLIKENIVR